MRPEAQTHWDEDDLELEKEFEDVASHYREQRRPGPRVPSALDRKIREQARYHIGDELRDSWIFGHVPQISLVASIFFGVGVYFVVAVDNEAPVDSHVPVVAEQQPAGEEQLREAARSSARDYRTQTNLEQDRRLPMTTPASLNALTGSWEGENSLWLDPEATPDQSDATATVETAAQKFVTISYTWAFEGKTQEGMLLIGSDDDVVQASWVDSFHMGNKIMTCDGSLLDDGGVSVTGSYTAPPGPDWGWRIEVHPLDADQFQLLMFNITPDGDESIAVEASFSRKS